MRQYENFLVCFEHEVSKINIQNDPSCRFDENQASSGADQLLPRIPDSVIDAEKLIQQYRLFYRYQMVRVYQPALKGLNK